ncbi:hypothetical protein QS257_18120 [Terrilactibacillus sp. S3-3]|nr:hypothetical protein QS257_18120 [Terrilactibacillus sp. S3-3]
MMNGWGMGVFGWIVQLLVLLFFVYLAVMIIKKSNNGSNNEDRSEAILKERFARGEITERKEYKKMKKVLHE